MNPLGHWKAARELDALVSHLRPGIVHAHFATTIFTTALARRATWPVTLGTFHGMSFPLVGDVKGRLLRAAESWASGRMDETWVLTAVDREHLRAAAPRARVEVQRSAGIGCSRKIRSRARLAGRARSAARETRPPPRASRVRVCRAVR